MGYDNPLEYIEKLFNNFERKVVLRRRKCIRRRYRHLRRQTDNKEQYLGAFDITRLHYSFYTFIWITSVHLHHVCELMKSVEIRLRRSTIHV